MESSNKITIVPPSFELIKVRCNAGHENPKMCYDENFFNYKNLFAKKYNLSEKSNNNILPEHMFIKDKAPLCCKLRVVSGQAFSISVKSDKSITIHKREVFSESVPLSSEGGLAWV